MPYIGGDSTGFSKWIIANEWGQASLPRAKKQLAL